LLTIAGLESGQMAISWQDLELRRLAQRVMDELVSKADARGVVLENAVPEGLGVSADLGRLQQVLTNLVDNAIKYGTEDGRVWVEAAQRAGETVISVNDNGPGIPAEARERVFERFFRWTRLGHATRAAQGWACPSLNTLSRRMAAGYGSRPATWVEPSFASLSRRLADMTIPTGFVPKSSLAKELKLPNTKPEVLPF